MILSQRVIDVNIKVLEIDLKQVILLNLNLRFRVFRAFLDLKCAKGLHKYSIDLLRDSTHHYYECKCGEKKDEEKHISSGKATATHDEVCTVCGYVIRKAVGISFDTLTVTDTTVYGKVSSDTEFYSFSEEIVVAGGAKYIVSIDKDGNDEIDTKRIALEHGYNVVYITEYINDVPTSVYTVVIRRTPVYTVTFDTNGGTAVESVTVDEDTIISDPEVRYEGYTLIAWDYDFTSPITKDTHITATWEANTDTKYKVEYYLENVTKNGYELDHTDESEGTTDTLTTAPIKEIEHFTFNAENSVLEGSINGDGCLVLKVCYTRNSYNVNAVSSDESYGTVSGSDKYIFYEEKITFTATNKPAITLLDGLKAI